MKDRFSIQASEYHRYRPDYPEALYNDVFGMVESFGTAWDAGCGNGQVAKRLAQSFKKVIATDISQQQLSRAPKIPHISYRIAQAGQSGIPGESADLITCAQAIHWFPIHKFINEAVEALLPGGVLAVWGYGLPRINAEVDKMIDRFYAETLGNYWDLERRHIDNAYADISFPDKGGKIRSRTYEMENTWDLIHLEGYLRSWSAYQNLLRDNQADPLPDLMSELRVSLPDKSFEILQPVFLRAWKKNNTRRRDH